MENTEKSDLLKDNGILGDTLPKNPEIDLPNTESDSAESMEETPITEEISEEQGERSAENFSIGEITEETGEPDEGESDDASSETQEPAVLLPNASPQLPRGSIVLKPWQLILTVLLVIVSVGGGVLLGMWLSNRDFDPDIDPNAKDYADLNIRAGDVTPGNFTAPGYKDISFRANTEKVQMILPNYEGNPCYIRFSLVLKDNGEILYRSGLVPPGKAITEITLSRPLDEGVYTLQLYVEALSLEDRSAMNRIISEIKLTVQ